MPSGTFVIAPTPRLKPYGGPAILSYGFRPFFLCGALFATIVIALWLPLFFGEMTLPNAFAPPVWHAHEMLFGFTPAVVTGFLLTAIPNWTGRLPLQGAPLLALLMVWLVGRIAVAASGMVGWLPTMVLDCAYLLILALVIAREIIAGKNWRNLAVLAIVALLFATNLAFHVEAHTTGAASYAERGAIAATIGRTLAVLGALYSIWHLSSATPLHIALAIFVYLAASTEEAGVLAEERHRAYDLPPDPGIWTAPPGYRWVQRGQGVWHLAPVVVVSPSDVRRNPSSWTG